MSQQRWADAEKGSPAPGPRILPETLEGITDPVTRMYFDYYRTPRGFHERSPNSSGAWTATSPMSFMNLRLLTYIGEISPRPVLLIAGENAHSRYFSEDAYKAAAQPKELMIVKSANHRLVRPHGQDSLRQDFGVLRQAPDVVGAPYLRFNLHAGVSVPEIAAVIAARRAPRSCARAAPKATNERRSSAQQGDGAMTDGVIALIVVRLQRAPKNPVSRARFRIQSGAFVRSAVSSHDALKLLEANPSTK